jgi:hypothetical protein
MLIARAWAQEGDVSGAALIRVGADVFFANLNPQGKCDCDTGPDCIIGANARQVRINQRCGRSPDAQMSSCRDQPSSFVTIFEARNDACLGTLCDQPA